MSDNDGARGPGGLARGWALLVARARRGAAPTQSRQGGVAWRVLLLGISALGSLATVFSLLAGHALFAGKLLLATLLVLGVLFLQAVL